MNFPALEKMTDDQKFEFLNKWCHTLSVKVDEHTATIQPLHERLQKVEGNASGEALNWLFYLFERF